MKQVDLDENKRMSWYLYAAYFVTGWWYLHYHILGTNDGHIQAVNPDATDGVDHMIVVDDYHGLV